jgi:hypothetical protein
MDTKYFTGEFQTYWKAEKNDGTSSYYEVGLGRSIVLEQDDKIVNVAKVKGFGLYEITGTEPILLGVFSSAKEIEDFTKTVNEPTTSETTNGDTPNDGDEEPSAKSDEHTGSRSSSKTGSTRK